MRPKLRPTRSPHQCGHPYSWLIVVGLVRRVKRPYPGPLATQHTVVAKCARSLRSVKAPDLPKRVTAADSTAASITLYDRSADCGRRLRVELSERQLPRYNARRRDTP